MSDDRKCARPTASGRPCANRIWGAERACKLHRTAEDEAWAAGYQAGSDRGRLDRQAAIEAAKGEVRAETERQVRAESREREAALTFRSREGSAQIVEVDGYAYQWRGPDLVIGDRVLLPPNWLTQMKQGPGPFEGTVTRVGSNYTGALASIIRIVAGARV